MKKTFFGLSVPFLELLGVQPELTEKGRAVVSLEVKPEHTNSWEAAHGAVVMALLDVSMGMAARSANDHAGGAATVNLSVDFLQAGTGRLIAEGRVLRNGRSLVFCEGEVRDANGEMVAKGLGTFKLRHQRKNS